MSVGVVVGTVIEELTEEVADADVRVDIKTHHLVNELFWSVIGFVGDDKVVALEQDGDWEVTAKIHIFGETCKRRDVGNVWSARISTGSDSLEELDKEVGSRKLQEEGLEVEEFRSVEEPSVSGRCGTNFEITEQVETVDDEQEIRDERGGRNLGVLFDVERIIERSCIEAEGHEYGAEIALEVNDCVVASRDGVFVVNSHLAKQSVGRSRSRSSSLRDFFLVFELEALKLGRNLEIECASGHCGGCVNCCEC